MTMTTIDDLFSLDVGHESEDREWRRKCDAFAEVCTRAMRERQTLGFWNAMRWLVVHHANTYGLHALADFLTSKSKRCVPDGWAMGVHDGQLIVAVFEQDDSHYDPPKWHELAWAFDSCDDAWLVEVRRRGNGPMLMRSEGTMALDSLDNSHTPVIVNATDWVTVTEIGPVTKTTTSRLDAWMRAQEASCDD